jgi:hypothetical protein
MAGFWDTITAPFTNAAATSAADRITGAQQTGLSQAGNLFGQARGAIGDYTNQALAPLQGLSGQLGGGLQTYLDAIGANGVAGLNNARGIFNAMVQPDISRATDITQRSGVAAGSATGNILDELARSTGRALQGNYASFAQGLNPLLGASQGLAGTQAGLLGRAGESLSGLYGQEAGATTNAYNRIGDAQAQAELARNQAGANIWGLGQNIARGIGGSSFGAGLSSGLGLEGLGASAGAGISGGLGSLGSSIASLAPMLFSDERLKENMAEVGELHDGTPVYEYNYIDDPTPRIGLSAQDVEQRRPDAVAEIGGYKAVDYRKATELARMMARRY